MEWNDNFSEARNASLKLATKDYILWMDADDFIAKQDIAKLRFHLMEHHDTAVLMNFIDKGVTETQQHAKQLRVIPNHRELEFRGRIHEQISFSVEEKGIKYSNSDAMVIHYGYANKENMVLKLQRNLRLLFIENEEKPDDFIVNLNISKTYYGLNNFPEAEKYVYKCMDIASTKKVPLNHEFIAYHSFALICFQTGQIARAIEVFEDKRYKFYDIMLFRLTLGQFYFKVGNYKQAYKDLYVLTQKNLSLSTTPINFDQTMKTSSNMFMFCCLHMGDFDNAEVLIKQFIGSPKFTIFKGDK
jgi:glycosyltransferase involved in cell wall biosynthesis